MTETNIHHDQHIWTKQWRATTNAHASPNMNVAWKYKRHLDELPETYEGNCHWWQGVYVPCCNYPNNCAHKSPDITPKFWSVTIFGNLQNTIIFVKRSIHLSTKTNVLFPAVTRKVKGTQFLHILILCYNIYTQQQLNVSKGLPR